MHPTTGSGQRQGQSNTLAHNSILHRIHPRAHWQGAAAAVRGGGALSDPRPGKGIQTILYRALRLCTTGIAKLQTLFTRQNGIIAEPSPRSQDSFFHILWEYPYQAGEMQYHLQYVRNLLV